MTNSLSGLLKKAKSLHSVYQPQIFRLSSAEDKSKFNNLLELPGIMVFDEIISQVEELIKGRNPKVKFDKDQLTREAISYIGSCPPEEFGVWLYYPWSNRLVHCLDKEEFIEVRTNRNQYKITKEEKEILSEKIIGIVGLSVGQSIALTIAMERICGEIRLADFDKLELSNLNRIRAGIHNFDIPKVVLAAREIAEIDPYIRVICYSEGLTETNMDQFFEAGGKLDVLVEECDGLDIKIICRYKAKELGIPVVMDMNDRGTLDIERFDLDPERSLLHGLIDHLQPHKIKDLSNQEKIPFILPILGEETISSKLKASMLEMGHTINTWPQLASAVVLGGALVTDVCRRIILNQFSASGRWFIDLEELISDPDTTVTEKSPVSKEINITTSTESLISAYFNKFNDQKSLPIDFSVLNEIVNAACLAPSKGNRQPWKWIFSKNVLFLITDYHSEHYFDTLSLGAAIENLAIKACKLCVDAKIELFPIAGNSNLAAAISFSGTEHKSETINPVKDPSSELASFIPERYTSRRPGIKKNIPEDFLVTIKHLTSFIPGVSLEMIDSRKEIQELSVLLSKLERMALMKKNIHSGFFDAIDWFGNESEKKISVPELDFSPNEYASYKMAKNWNVIENLIEWKGGEFFEKKPYELLSTSSALGFMFTDSLTAQQLVNTGRLMERIWLQSTKEGISFQPFSLVPELLFKSDIDLQDDSNSFKSHFNILKKNIIESFSPENKQKPLLLIFRLFYSESVNRKSKRRSMKEALTFFKD